MKLGQLGIEGASEAAVRLKEERKKLKEERIPRKTIEYEKHLMKLKAKKENKKKSAR